MVPFYRFETEPEQIINEYECKLNQLEALLVETTYKEFSSMYFKF